MNTLAELNVYNDVPVNIGGMVLYCRHFRADGARNFDECADAAGGTFFSNNNKKALRLTFEGKVYRNSSDSLAPAVFFETLLTNNASFDVEYKNVSFKNCRVEKFSADENEDYFIGVSVTLVTTG